MMYESVKAVESTVAPGVRFLVARVSFARRLELMRQVRDLSKRLEYLQAGEKPTDKMDAAVLAGEIDRLYVAWGLRGVEGLQVDGVEATPESLADAGPESLFREALAAIRAEVGLDEAERKNS